MKPSLRLLLVDDERLQHRLVAQMLLRFTALQFELEVAATHREGLERLLTGGYAAALLDYELPDGDGLSLLRSARAQGCRTPVIFLTANSGADLDAAALEAGAEDYLEKASLSPRGLERSLRYTLKLAESFEQLRRQATRDPLTGLLNRREFDRLLASELRRGRRFSHPVSLALIDLDHFKHINDTHGHVAGDEVLRHVADVVARYARTVDFVARYGGEELAMIMIEVDAESAGKVIERIARAVRDLPALAQGVSIPVTFSAGLACSVDGEDDPVALIAAADRALYAAKRAGRNRIIVAGCEDGLSHPRAAGEESGPGLMVPGELQLGSGI